MIHFHYVININLSDESYLKLVRIGIGPKGAFELNL